MAFKKQNTAQAKAKPNTKEVADAPAMTNPAAKANKPPTAEELFEAAVARLEQGDDVAGYTLIPAKKGEKNHTVTWHGPRHQAR